ncbi:MAG: cytochrome C oxidase subunit IV family protein [Hahellaceae bacterium]|nr:cytochrome C oxidase subunit IV family protein [Hahellaceae bacterium]
MSYRELTLYWLALIALSVASLTATHIPSPLILLLSILTLAFGKAWIIVDYFMGLRSVKRSWRLALLLWPLLLCLLIGTILSA